MDIFTIDVGFTTTRPIVVDEHSHRVIVAARDDTEAKIIAAQIVGGGCEMVTSTKIIRVEI